jgi:uncharacterized membrane protein YfcA
LIAGSYLLPEKEVIALSAVFFFAAEVARVVRFRSEFRPGRMLLFGAINLPFVALGALLLGSAPTSMIRYGLAMLVLLHVFQRRCGITVAHVSDTGIVVLGASIHGLLSGLLGSGSTIKAVLFRGVTGSREQFISIMASTGLLASAVKIGVYVKTGLFRIDHVAVAFVLVATAIVSTLAGAYLLRQISENRYQDALDLIFILGAAGLLIGR